MSNETIIGQQVPVFKSWHENKSGGYNTADNK